MEFASKIITLVSDLLSRCGGPLRATFGGGSSFSVRSKVHIFEWMEQKIKNILHTVHVLEVLLFL